MLLRRASARCWRRSPVERSNKEAGRRLAISPRTIEVHRSRIMEKTGARNAADLVRIVLGGRSRGRSLAHGDASAGIAA